MTRVVEEPRGYEEAGMIEKLTIKTTLHSNNNKNIRRSHSNRGNKLVVATSGLPVATITSIDFIQIDFRLNRHLHIYFDIIRC